MNSNFNKEKTIHTYALSLKRSTSDQSWRWGSQHQSTWVRSNPWYPHEWCTRHWLGNWVVGFLVEQGRVNGSTQRWDYRGLESGRTKSLYALWLVPHLPHEFVAFQPHHAHRLLAYTTLIPIGFALLNHPQTPSFSPLVAPTLCLHWTLSC